MNTLSLRENEQQRLAADRLCGVIERHAEALRQRCLGKRFELEGVSFQLYRADRNVIYRVSDGDSCFLKMPRSGNPEPIEREVVGASAVRHALRDCPVYTHPRVVRASVDHSYVLTSRIKGRMLNRSLYLSVVLPLQRVHNKLNEAFFSAGAALSRLHQDSPAAQVTLKRTAETSLEHDLCRTTRPDNISRRIQERFLSPGAFPSTDSLAHGNFTLENVIVSGRSVSIIDFENCGRGARYHDLSMICSQLLCMGTAIHVPASRLDAARSDFLRGYKQHGSFDPHLLGKAVVMRVCNWYLYGFCHSNRRPTVAGIPVSQGRARRLVALLLESPPANL